MGMMCWVNYNFANVSDVFSLDEGALFLIIDTLKAVATDDVAPVVRIPLTATSWLGIPTKDSAPNMAK